MGHIHIPAPSTLFIALTCADSQVQSDDIVPMLSSRFGEIDYTHGPIPFTHTDYYAKEMGTGLSKTYLAFKDRIERDTLPAIKHASNHLEKHFSKNGKRAVNIDPGYVAPDKLVLASTKDFFHRIYLADGIFAEVTLHYRRGKFRYFSWTYPDYKEPDFLDFLEKVRASLVHY